MQNAWLPSPSGLPQLEAGAVAAFLRRGEQAALDLFLDRYLGPLHDDGADFAQVANYLVTDVLVIVTHFAQEMDAPPAALLPGAAEAVSATPQTKGALRAALRTMLARALNYRDRHADRIQRLVEQAKAYIAAHFTDEDVSLAAVAATLASAPATSVSSSVALPGRRSSSI